jgi:soluble lytic murein transglycosylase-like protein
MQVMPFWVKLIGTPQHNLFDMQTNLRFGCTILRYYLDQEKGNLSRALSRYNGSVGKRKYANAVLTALHTRWHYSTEQRMVSKERPKGFLQTRAPQ